MDAVRSLPGVNLNFLGLVTASLTPGATTITLTAVATGGLLTVARDGVKATLSAGAKAYNERYGNGNADPTVYTITAGQARIVVFGLQNIGGTETLVSVVGKVARLDAADKLLEPLEFPAIGDSIVPVAYATIKNPTSTSLPTFTVGTNNWNAASIVTTITDIAALPRRPLDTV